MRKITIQLFILIIFNSVQLNVLSAKPKKPRNIILLIGDGTGLAQLYAARTAAGGQLSIFEWAQFVGLSITESADDYVTDSGAGATAISIGKKAKNGMIGVAADSTPCETIAETALKKGLSAGTVVTCELTHATPASFFAHQVSRTMYPQIAADITRSGATVLIGGGFPYFDTNALKKQGLAVSIGIEQMMQNKAPRQCCFYTTDSSVARFEKRGKALEKGTEHAIGILRQNKKGFFLMVEGSQIDWGGHDNDSAMLLNEAMDFDHTAKLVLEWAKKDGQTLVIVTADHECGGLTLPGYDSLNQRPVMHFSTTHHTAEPVPVFAFGPGAEKFAGVYQNTEIYSKMFDLLFKP